MLFHKVSPPQFLALWATRLRHSCPWQVRTAVLPTSTSEPLARRSEEHSAATRRPGAAANSAPIAGRRTCDARHARSTTEWSHQLLRKELLLAKRHSATKGNLRIFRTSKPHPKRN